MVRGDEEKDGEGTEGQGKGEAGGGGSEGRTSGTGREGDNERCTFTSHRGHHPPLKIHNLQVLMSGRYVKTSPKSARRWVTGNNLARTIVE
jgi:hypothetical protein